MINKIREEKAKDPRFKMAEALLAPTSRITHPMEGIAALAKALSGKVQMDKLEGEYKQREDMAQSTLGGALAAYDRSQMGGTTQLKDGNKITWDKATPEQAEGYFKNGLASNPDTADMATEMTMNDMSARKSLAQALAEKEGMLKLEQQYPTQGNSPAAVQIADEIAKARAAGDMQRVNDLLLTGKMLEKGVTLNPDGSTGMIGGYTTQLENISKAKQDGANISDLNYKPQIKSAELQAENTTQAQIDLPSSNAEAQQILDLLDGIEKDPGLSAAVGFRNPFKGALPMGYNVSGTPAADFQAKIDQLGGKQFLQAFESLKGGGQITEVEGAKATNAIARMQTSQSEEAFKAALDEFKGIVQTGMQRAQAKAGIPQGAPNMPTGQEPTQQPQAPVTKVINGVTYVKENGQWYQQ